MIHVDELEKLESLMQSKAFAELTTEEKLWVSQWIESEAEYTNLRKANREISQHLISTNQAVPDPKILTQLKASLRAKQIVSQLNWWQVKMPGWSTGVIASFFCVAGWWIGSSSNEVIKEQVYSPIVYDTVYLASKPDTVFIQQVVYRERSLLAKTVKQLETLTTETPAKGINMKEKEELENLLVSGSR